MSQSQSQTTFAYGVNNHDGCECPALAAGMDPCGTGDNHIPGLLEAAERYDSFVQANESGFKGTVGEEVAKDAWMEMLRQAKQNDKVEQTAAEEVAAYHDWI